MRMRRSSQIELGTEDCGKQFAVIMKHADVDSISDREKMAIFGSRFISWINNKHAK
jgi:hypothetical protein